MTASYSLRQDTCQRIAPHPQRSAETAMWLCTSHLPPQKENSHGQEGDQRPLAICSWSVKHSRGERERGMLQLQPDDLAHLIVTDSKILALARDGSCLYYHLNSCCHLVYNNIEETHKTQQAASQPDSKHFLHSIGQSQ